MNITDEQIECSQIYKLKNRLYKVEEFFQTLCEKKQIPLINLEAIKSYDHAITLKKALSNLINNIEEDIKDMTSNLHVKNYDYNIGRDVLAFLKNLKQSPFYKGFYEHHLSP